MKKAFKIFGLFLVFTLMLSVFTVSVSARSTTYQYTHGEATMELGQVKVSARMTSENAASLNIWGQYQYQYVDDDNSLQTSDWQSVTNYYKYCTDTGANGWKATSQYSMCSLHNKFSWNGMQVLNKYMYK